MPPSFLIVSHGQPSDPEIGEIEIRDLAHRVQRHMPDAQVTGVTLAAPDALEAAMDQAQTPTIYPFFMADGWFTQSALPKRIAACPNGAAARQLPAFGLDPNLPAFTDRWLDALLARQGWAARDTALFIAGHGSGRSPRPAQATRDFAARLSLPFADIRCGFVEEPPFLTDKATGLPAQSLCLPFFALKRGHVIDDIPQALDATGFSGLRLDPFGLHPDLPAFLANSLRNAA